MEIALFENFMWREYITDAVISLARPLLLACFLYALFEKFSKNCFSLQTSHKSTLTPFFKDLFLTLLSLLIFQILGFIIAVCVMLDKTKLYFDIEQYGIPYFIFSVFVLIIVQDIYFYMVHRLLHNTKILFKAIHYFHHQRFPITVSTAYVFHWMEAILYSIAILLLTFTIPLHIYAVGIFSFILLLISMLGHSAYEFRSSFLYKTQLYRVLNLSTYHFNHHRHINTNLGLFTCIWDKLFNTFDYSVQEEYVAKMKQELAVKKSN